MSASARVRLKGREIEISHRDSFGPGDTDRFLRRVFAHADTEEVLLDPARRRFRIRLLGTDTDSSRSVSRLAELMVATTVPEESMPVIPTADPLLFKRWRGIVTLLSLKDLALGRVHVRVPRSARNAWSGEGVAGIRRLPGVHRIQARRLPARISVSYDPGTDPTVWVRALERLLHPVSTDIMASTPPRTLSLMAHTNLFLCTTGQFFFPPAIPFVSGVLLASRIPQFSRAARDLSHGKVGTPFYSSVVVSCSVAAMAPFASALAEWLTLHWERRARQQVARETEALLQALPLAPPALSPGASLKSVRLLPGVITAFDGEISEGEVLVRDALFIAPEQALLEKKRAGDTIDSGYQVIAGDARLHPSDTSMDDRVSSVIRVLSSLPLNLAESQVLKKEAQRIGEMSVYPNLALAGMGYFVGGLHVAGALLHQDWTASPQIAAPTEFFKDLRTGLEHGALIQSPESLKALAETSLLLVDEDYPGLATTRPRIIDIASDPKDISRANDWAGVLAAWVGDARSEALLDLARISNEPPPEAHLLSLENGLTRLSIDGESVTLEDVDEGGDWLSLRLTVKGEPEELLRFGSTDLPRWGRTFSHLRGLGVAVVVYGPGAAKVGAAIGADAVYPGLDGASLAEYRANMLKEGYPPAILSATPLDDSILEGKPLIIGPLEPLKMHSGPGIQLLSHSLAGLPELVLAARTMKLRLGFASLRTIPTNLLCILGAFAGVFNGTMTTAIAHGGVFGVSVLQGRRIRTPHPRLLTRQS
jgi:hypothetical protein